jgi:predicted nucleotidyltransferase component of viral defense system
LSQTPFPTTSEITQNLLFLWIMHRMTEEFKDHAILKGGMQLRLLDCPRSTNDLDYIFCPYKSKKEIEKKIEKILEEIPQSEITITKNSKVIVFSVKVKDVYIQVEAQVAPACSSIPISTNSISDVEKILLPKVIKVMSLDVAFSHKLAAWNERRLYRDLYDIYYFYRILKVKFHIQTLLDRLKNIESRLPQLKKVKSMTLEEFKNQLIQEVDLITDKKLKNELSALLSMTILEGLSLKIQSSLREFIINLD